MFGAFRMNRFRCFLKMTLHGPLCNPNGIRWCLIFLADQKKKEKRMCVILDLPEDNHHAVRSFICEAVNRGTDLKMFYSKQRSDCRIILEGAEDSVFRIMQEFHEKF